VNEANDPAQTAVQPQGKRPLGFLARLNGLAGAAVAAAKKRGSEKAAPDGQVAINGHGHLSPLSWLLIAASVSGASAALVIVIGFAILDNTGAALAPVKERAAALSTRLDAIERAEVDLARRSAADESTQAKTAASVASILAEIRKMQEALFPAASQGHAGSGPAASGASLGHIEARLAALEGKLGVAPPGETGLSAASTAHDSREEANFPPFDPANFTPLLVWLAISFGLLYVLMTKIGVPRVEHILKSRADKIRADVTQANMLRAKSEEAAAAHEKTVADAKAKAIAMAQATHARLNAESEAKRHGLEAELNRKLASSEEQVRAMKIKAMSHVDEIASETAAAIVQHITGAPADRGAVARAIATIKA